MLALHPICKLTFHLKVITKGKGIASVISFIIHTQLIPILSTF